MRRPGQWLFLWLAMPATAVAAEAPLDEAPVEEKPVLEAPVEEAEKMLVAQLAAESGVSASTTRLLGDLLANELRKTKRWEVIAEADIQAMLAVESRKQLAGCDDVGCIAELGGAMGAERVLTGSVGQVGGLYVLNLKVVNTRKASTDARWSDSVGGDESALVAAVRVAVADIVRQIDPEAAKALTPTTPPAVADAAEPAVYERWWFWTAIGVVVVGGALAGYAATREGGDELGLVHVTATVPSEP